MSDTTGVRRLPAMGNAGQRLSWTIKNLTSGTFYWSVQAIDNSFAGSPFSAEQSFYVSNRAPVAISRSVTISEDTSVNITLTGSDPDGDPLTAAVVSPPLFGSLSGAGAYLTYRPMTNYFGFDQFVFRVNDRVTDSEPATIFIEVTPVQDVSNPTLGIEPLSAGQARLRLKGEPWKSYRVEASEDLVHWMPLTNLLCTNLLTALVDADASRFNQRFYRAASVHIEPEFGPSLAMEQTTFRFIVSGEIGRNYEIQASTNLVNWTAIAHVMLTNPVTPFVDANAGGFSQRFYRIVSP